MNGSCTCGNLDSSSFNLTRTSDDTNTGGGAMDTGGTGGGEATGVRVMSRGGGGDKEVK